MGMSKSEQLLACTQRGASLTFIKNAITDMLYELDKADPSRSRVIYEHSQAAVLSQICYWFSPDKSGKPRARLTDSEGSRWIFKSKAEWWGDVRVTEAQLRNILDKLIVRRLILKDLKLWRGKYRQCIRLNDDVFAPLYEDLMSRDSINPFLNYDEFVEKKDGSDVVLEDNETDVKVPSNATIDSVITQDSNALEGVSSITEITDQRVRTYTAEGSDLPSNPITSASTESTESNNDLDSTREEGPPSQKPRVVKNGVKRNGKKNGSVVVTAETRLLKQLHLTVCKFDRKYRVAHGRQDLPDLKAREADRALAWIDAAGEFGIDIREEAEAERFVNWFVNVKKPKMGAPYDVMPMTLNWLLSPTNLQEYLSARPKSEEEKVREYNERWAKKNAVPG